LGKFRMGVIRNWWSGKRGIVLGGPFREMVGEKRKRWAVLTTQGVGSKNQKKKKPKKKKKNNKTKKTPQNQPPEENKTKNQNTPSNPKKTQNNSQHHKKKKPTSHQTKERHTSFSWEGRKRSSKEYNKGSLLNCQLCDPTERIRSHT